jgi:cyclic beta-1,2-glucan synthetase
VVAAADPAFFPRLHENVQVLREADRYLASSARIGYHVTPAAAWLLDNFHLIESQFREVHEGLPHSYFRALPVLIDEPLAGLPRVYGIAWAFVAHTDGAFDEELLVQFLTGLSNVVLGWPLLAAVLHTGGAGALMMVLTCMLSQSKSNRP